MRAAMRLLLAGLIAALEVCAAAETVAEPVSLSFPMRSVDGVVDLMTGDRSDTTLTTARLYLPDGLSPGERAPAMVILHGSGGEWSGRGARHGAFLSENGVAALMVDSFGARGLDRDMRYIERLRRANMPDQIADAYAALAVLFERPEIAPRRIGVMGYSMGGSAALLAASRQVADAVAATEARFALHVAFYAPCFTSAADPLTTGAPILAVWGEEDESSYRADCDRTVAALSAGGSEVEAHWLAGAAHGWNSAGARKYRPTAPRGSPCRYEIQADGAMIEHVTGRRVETDRDLIEVLETCSAQGYTIGRDDTANAEANRLLLKTIQRVLRP